MSEEEPTVTERVRMDKALRELEDTLRKTHIKLFEIRRKVE